MKIGKSGIGLACLGLLMLGGCTSQPQTVGTSVRVLLDFSKSFVPLSKADGRVLDAVNLAMITLAADKWSPPITFAWSKVESTSILSPTICGPLQFEEKLIKSDSDLDRASLRRALDKCSEAVLKASRDPEQQSPYTDLSGAIALAGESGKDERGEKVLVVISDFLEDLPPGSPRTRIVLHGERVLLVHRPGIDLKEQNVHIYSARLESWANQLRMAGAKQVIALPGFAVTASRIIRVFEPEAARVGTSVGVVVSMREIQKGKLAALAHALAQLGSKWPLPVTYLWSRVHESALDAQWMPPIEYDPKLISGDGPITRENLGLFLTQCADGLERSGSFAATQDLGGAITLQVEAAVEREKILFVVSDFAADEAQSDLPGLTLNNMRVVMIGVPNAKDATNESSYFARLNRWEVRFEKLGAGKVCRVQLRDMTANAIEKCAL